MMKGSLRRGIGGLDNRWQRRKRAARGMRITPAQFDSRRRDAGWISDEDIGAGGTANAAQNGSSSVSRTGGVEPAHTSGSTLHVKPTSRTFFAKHTARKGIGFHVATMSSTKFSPSLPKEGLYEESRVHHNLVWRRKVSRGRDLYNGGSTCFLNATLQYLVFLPPLAQHFLEEDYSEMLTRGQTVNHKAGAIRPTELLRNLRLVGSQYRHDIEEDAHEFLRQLLQGIADSCLKWSKSKLAAPSSNVKNNLLDKTTAIHRIFGGCLCSRLKCRNCGHCSDKYEQFLDLSPRGVTTVEGALEAFMSVEHLKGSNRWCCIVCKKLVEADKNLTIFKVKCRSCGHCSDKDEQFLDLSMELPKGVTTVEGALRAFTSVERLKGSNRWCFNFCKKLVEADKNLTIFKPPNALVVHLKRFAVQGRRLTKMKTQIGFGESLAVKLSGPEGRAVYDLTGVVQHFGKGRRRSHYVALVKTSRGKWCQADDAHVFEVDRRQVASAQAYVLFYTRRRPALALAAPSPPALPPPTVLGGSGRSSSGMVRPTLNTNGSVNRVDIEDVGEVVSAEKSGGAPTSREASRPPSLPETTDRACPVGAATTLDGLKLVLGAGQHGGGAVAETSVADDSRTGGEETMADSNIGGKPAPPQFYENERGSGERGAEGSREGDLTQGKTGRRAWSSPVCVRGPVEVSKRKKLKNRKMGSTANASGHKEAFSPRGGGEARGDLPSGVASMSSAADAVRGTGTTQNDNGGEGGRSSSVSSRDKSSETCEVTGKRVVVPWRPAKSKSKELFAQKIDSWMDGDKHEDGSLVMNGEDLQRVAFQKELQAGLSQNQAAAENKDKWSRSASFWDRSLDMGKLKKVKDKEATALKLGESTFQARQEELHSKSRRGYPEAVPHKMAPTNGEYRGVSSGEGLKRIRGGSGGEHKRGRGGGNAKGGTCRH